MRLRCSKGERAGWIADAEITADHASSREGVPVLVLGGEPVPVIAAAEAGYEIFEATEAERAALRVGGYALPETNGNCQPAEGAADAEGATP